jgi:predicted HTH domain antitoxin
MAVLSVRLDKDLEKKLEYLMKKLKIKDKSAYIRQLLDKALSEEIIDILCKQVGEKQMSAWKAAEFTGISLRRFLQELKKRHIPGFDERALEEDLKFASE